MPHCIRKLKIHMYMYVQENMQQSITDTKVVKAWGIAKQIL